jgi:hypothetical protein
MSIKNRNLHADARYRCISHVIKLVTADNQSFAYLDMANATRVIRAETIFNTANGATNTQNVTVGTIATPTLYVNYAVADSQAAGVIVSHTLASSAEVPAGTALLIKKSSAAADTGSTAELTLNVWIERLDNASA